MSTAWLDRYYIWKLAGFALKKNMLYRDAEAFLALLEEERKEIRDAQNTNIE